MITTQRTTILTSQEQDLVPYNISNLPPSPFLIFSPHPDDETFGMGGTIALAGKQKIEVNVVIVTDGDAGGEATTRKKESCRAASILGIDDLVFLGFPDRQIPISEKTTLLFSQLIEKFTPKTIFLPSPLEFHPDHRIVTHIATQAINKMDFKCKIWLYEVSRQGEANCFINITNALEIKQKAMDVYQSQLTQRAYKEYVLALNRLRAYTLPQHIKYVEAFWAVKETTEEVFEHIKKYSIKRKNYITSLKRFLPFIKN